MQVSAVSASGPQSGTLQRLDAFVHRRIQHGRLVREG